MSLIDFPTALKEIVPNSILFTGVPKPKIDWAGETDAEIASIGSLIKLSKTKVEFLENLDMLSIEKIRQIEPSTRGRYCIEQWYFCRKGVIRASKAHEVIKKFKKLEKEVGV